jgi:uncharacterized protein involved in outer membrane biogenesis
MKAIKVIFVILLVFAITVVAGFQLFLSKGLTSALNKTVFPAVKTFSGLEMSIGNATANLFGGSAKLEGFKLRNLKGYKEPYLLTFDRCELKIDLASLLSRDPVIINLAKAEGVTVTVERNDQRKFNVQKLVEALKPVESTKQESSQESETVPVKKKPPLPIRIRQLSTDGKLNLVNIE